MALTKKFLAPMVLLFVAMLAMPCFAAITVTWSIPASGTSYNNNPANAGNIDLNFAVTDNNATVKDHNISIVVRNSVFATVETLVSDYNVHSGIYVSRSALDLNCSLVNITTLLSGYTCHAVWDMPENAVMGDGTYYLDVNVSNVIKTGDVPLDKNAMQTITINTRMGTMGMTKDILLVSTIVLIAAVIVAAILGMFVLNADPTKTAIGIAISVLVIAFIAMVLGMILGMM